MSHISIKNNPTLAGMSEVIKDVEFSKENNLKMQIINPWWDRTGGVTPRYPLVVFVQGSGWTFPNVGMQIPQLVSLVNRGFVVATITHRNAYDGFTFPACLQDVKTAIRFLRCNAAIYGIDENRVGIWGTSSGGNLALLTALTMGDERYETKEYSEYSDKVDYCVACFPPTDLVESMQDDSFNEDIKITFLRLAGLKDNSGKEALKDSGKKEKVLNVLKEMSPYHIVKEMVEKKFVKKLPPIFIGHGDSDKLIPYSDGKKMYDVLCDYNEKILGKENENRLDMVTVQGADHEGTFWSEEMLGIIYDFIEDIYT